MTVENKKTVSRLLNTKRLWQGPKQEITPNIDQCISLFTDENSSKFLITPFSARALFDSTRKTRFSVSLCREFPNTKRKNNASNTKNERS